MATRALPGSTAGSSADKQSSADGRGIQGVFFDLGGTLFTYAGMPSRSGPLLMATTKKMGINAAPKEIGLAYQKANKKVAKSYGEKSFYLHADLFRDVFIEFCEGVGGEFELELWEDYRHKHDAAVIDALEIRPDCRPTMQLLRERGLYLSIASNIDHFMLEALVERESLLGGYSAGMQTALISEPGVTPPLQSGKQTVEPDHKIDALTDLLDILQ